MEHPPPPDVLESKELRDPKLGHEVRLNASDILISRQRHDQLMHKILPFHCHNRCLRMEKSRKRPSCSKQLEDLSQLLISKVTSGRLLGVICDLIYRFFPRFAIFFMASVEVVHFLRPTTDSKNSFVSQLSTDTDVQSPEELLHTVLYNFSVY